MLALVALASALMVDSPTSPPAADPAAIQRDYAAARNAAGRTPEDQVRLAYWCEAHGLTAERMKHLAQAVLADPNHAAARGLLGLVARQDRWMRPDAVAAQVKDDPALAATLAEYDARRSSTPYTADGQWSLALWAEERGLKEQAKAHLTATIRLDPKRDQAWKKLSYVKHDGHWATDAELATAKTDAEAQKAADQKWKLLMEKWKTQLARPSQRAEAEANLLTVTDPRAVPMVGKVFGSSASDGSRMVQLLGQIDAPAASRALAYLAAFSPAADTRRVATETLRGRDPREYANLLISLIHKPIKYELKPVNGPNSPGVLYVVGEKSNVKRLYEPKSFVGPTDQISTDRFGQPVIEQVIDSWGNSRRIDPRMGAVSGRGRLSSYQASYSDFYSQSSFGFGAPLPTNAVPQSNPALMSDWNRLMQSATSHPDSMGKALANLGTSLSANHNQKGPRNASLPFTPIIGAGGGLMSGQYAAGETTAEYSLSQAVAESNKSARVSQQQLDNDLAQVEAQNRSITEVNDRVVGILNHATGETLSPEPSAWQSWWINLLGYAQVAGQTEQNPTFVEVIPSGYQPELMPTNVTRRAFTASVVDCFGAGTPVQTMTGTQPIERLKVGDMVLTQSTTTGALRYKPILVTHHNPPAATFLVHLSDDRLVVSQFHRFWVARRGWVMARDLKAGDSVRTLNGIRDVESVEPGQVELVYNLDIADDADFFAGTSAALVHDNTLPDPRLVPFDLPAPVKAVAAR